MVHFVSVKEVRELLRSDLEQKCVIDGVKSLTDTLSIKSAPLQMTHYQENTTAPDSGHQHTREEIQNLYKKHSMGDILPENFFKKSREFVKEFNDYKNALNDKAKEYYLNKRGNVVGVIGQAGVGKTTFSKVLLNRILNKEENLYNADYIFYVKLRDFQNQNKIKLGLLDFLFKNISSDWPETIDCFKRFLNHLSDSDSVVIILDGFDEIDNTQFKNHSNLKLDMHGEKSPLDFISGLLSGEILPKAKKIITSRPRQLLNLRPDFKPKFFVTIVGIDDDSQKQICEDICKNHKQTQKVWNYVENQPELKSYCYVPIMAILIFHTIYQNLLRDKLDKQTSTSITQVLAYNLNLFIYTDHVHKNNPDHICDLNQTKTKLKSLSKLSKLAYEGIVQRTLYFSDNDFQKAGLSENDISPFLTTFHADDTSNPMAALRKITQKLSYFSHLIWQEFFAAIHIIFDLKQTFFYLNQIDLSSSQFEVVTKFLFGLCNDHTVKILNDIDDEYIFLSNNDASVLKEHLHSHLKKIASNFRNRHLFRLASLLYELKDKTLTREFSNLLPSILEIKGDVFPNDVFPLCELIRARQRGLEISINKPSFYKNSHLLFFKEMESIIAESLHLKVKIYLILLFNDQNNRNLNIKKHINKIKSFIKVYSNA